MRHAHEELQIHRVREFRRRAETAVNGVEHLAQVAGRAAEHVLGYTVALGIPELRAAIERNLDEYRRAHDDILSGRVKLQLPGERVGRAYFDGRNELADLIDTRILGWQIGSDAVIWIAATALWLGCPVVTHNARDFSGIPGRKALVLRRSRLPNRDGYWFYVVAGPFDGYWLRDTSRVDLVP